jgi:hypothetical protein
MSRFYFAQRAPKNLRLSCSDEDPNLFYPDYRDVYPSPTVVTKRYESNRLPGKHGVTAAQEP